MNTTNTTTKKEIRNAALNAHYAALSNIAALCGVSNISGKKLSVTILLLERQARELTTDYCNGENNVTTANFPEKIQPVKDAVNKLFNNNLKGFFVNTDARGTALKIKDTVMQSAYKDTGLTIDWGGDGMLCPTIE